MDDPHDLLPWGEALEHGAADGFLTNALDEISHHSIVNISLEQCEANLAQGLTDIRFRELASTSKPPEDFLKSR